MQRNWIGRSRGAHVDFPIEPATATDHPVFTTRPDTLFGATYMVLAPEHDAGRRDRAGRLAGGHQAGLDRRARDARRRRWPRTGPQAAAKTDEERTADAKVKTGVFTGAYATNPVNGERIPVFIADYVLAGYGTGAIMAVPGQDERDWAFAEVFDLPIIRTVAGAGGLRRARTPARAPAINSDWLNGMGVADAKASMISWLEENGHGTRRDHLPAAGLAVQPAALLGRAVPDRLRRDRPAGRAARVDAAGGAARRRRLLAAHLRPGRRGQRAGDAAVAQEGLGRGRAGPGRRPEDATPARPTPCRSGPARAGTSCATWTRTTTRCWSTRRTRRYWMGPQRRRRLRRRRPVRRRRRARRAAPAVRPLLAQGAVRPGPHLVVRAVPQAVQPGLHPGVRVPRRPRRRRARRGGRRARRQVLLRRRRRSPASTARWASR